jgi:hypothetical protein
LCSRSLGSPAVSQNHPPSPTQRRQTAERLARVQAYGKPRRVWVDDGHVFVEEHDGTVVSMTPEVAIEFGRSIARAGADSLANQVMDRSEVSEVFTA